MALTQVSSDGIKNLNVKTADLENSGVTAGTYGSASLIPALVIDAKGRVTSASTNSISTDLVNDTSPQLGGNLDTNNFVINFSTDGEAKAATFGAGADLKVFSDGTNGVIKSVNGDQYIQSDVNVRITSEGNTETMAKFIKDGAVELYHNNSKKFETTSDGATVTGNLFATNKFRGNDNVKLELGTGNDLQIFHNGSNSKIDNSTGTLFIQGDAITLTGQGGSENLAVFTKNGSVELNYDNSKKFETTSGGVSVTGEVSTTGHIRVPDSMALIAGTGSDLFIYHDGNHSYIQDTGTGDLTLIASKTVIGSSNNAEVCASFTENGAVALYHDNSKKLETYASGIIVSGGRITGSDGDDLTFQLGTSHAQIFRTNDTERMRISSDDIFIGKTSDNFDTAGAHIDDGGQMVNLVKSGTGDFIKLNRSTNVGVFIEFRRGSSNSVGNISSNNTTTSYNTSSDYRLKENVVAISDGITRLKTLKPSRFNFKTEKDTTVDGFLAHEVTAVPEAVTGVKDAVDSDNNPIYQGIDQSKLVPLLTAAVQEAISKIEILETEVAALKAR